VNTITYKDLKQWYINNDDAEETAKKVFGGKQPSIHQTGFYSSPSWGWGYIIGIAKDDFSGELYEAVTQFGVVKAARIIYL